MEPTDARPRRGIPPWLIDLVIILALCIGFFWKLILTRQYTFLENPDLANQVLPWYQFQAAEWHQGRIPLWDPCLWGGQSLIGQAQPGVAYPLNWVISLLPLKNGFIRQSNLHWYLVVIHFMAAWFCYLLCRDLKRSRMASIAAGVIFSLGGWMAAIEWPQLLNSALWAPLVFLYMLRSLRGHRPLASAAVSGAFFGVAWLGGHHQAPVFLALATGGIWLFYVLREGRPNFRIARLFAVFLIFTVLVGGLQIVPAVEYGKLAKRWVGAIDAKGWNEPVPYSVHSQFSLIPTSLVGLFVPGYARHADPFIGLGALALALLAVAMAWKERAVRIFAAVAAGGLLFSLGRNNVFHGMIYALVPLVEKARLPAFALFIYHFGIAVLAAYGIDSFSSENNSRWPRRAVASLTVYALLVFAVFSTLVIIQKASGDDRVLVIALVALLLAGVFHAWRKGHVSQGAAGVLVLGLMLIEFGNVAGFYWPNKEDKDQTIYLNKLTEHADIAAFIKTMPGPARCEVPSDEIAYNFGDWYGIDQLGGRTVSLPVNFLRLPWAETRGRQFFGVNCIVARKPPERPVQEVFQGTSGLKVYLDHSAFPRVWAVHEAARIHNEGEIAPVFNDAAMDLRHKTFLLEAPPPMEPCAGGDDVRLAHRAGGQVTIEASMGCKGMVILADGYFPGWSATVDGKPARIYEAYTAVRGVVVDKGKHTVEMRYHPGSVLAGLAMTLFGVLGAVVLAWRAPTGSGGGSRRRR